MAQMVDPQWSRNTYRAAASYEGHTTNSVVRELLDRVQMLEEFVGGMAEPPLRVGGNITVTVRREPDERSRTQRRG